MTQNSPEIFNRSLYLARQQKASGTEFLWNHLVEELNDRLGLVMKTFPKSLVISNQGGLISSTPIFAEKCLSTDWRSPSLNEHLDLPTSNYDAIFSLLDLHCINDVPGHLAQMARALKPDGVLFVAFFAGETLHELRESWLHAEIALTGGVSPRVAPMIGVRELGGLMQRAGLALPVADMDHATIRYADVFALMNEIKNFGYSNPMIGRSNRFISKRFISTMAEHYHNNFADADGRIRATLEIAWAVAWKPHESQPKPLQPGSAKHSLHETLNNRSNLK